MYARGQSGASRQAVVGVLAVVACAACAAMLVLLRAAQGGVENVKAAFELLDTDKALAQKYLTAQAQAIEPSSGDIEARSYEFLNSALGRYALPSDSVSYGDISELPGGGGTMRVEIACNSVPLSSVIGFVRDVETGRKNLGLLSADIQRADDTKDLWDVNLTYLAVIRAKSRT